MTDTFDKYTETYESLHAGSIKASGYAPAFFDEHKIKVIHRELTNVLPMTHERTFLNFGCGIGKSERYIRAYFPDVNIVSVDVSAESIKMAEQRNANLTGVRFVHYNAIQELQRLPRFDVIFVANVFHHIPSGEHLEVMKALKALLKNEGFLFLFEHNPINPLTRNAFEKCEFDAGCTMLSHRYLLNMAEKSGFRTARVKFVLFFPGFLSALNRFEKYLSAFPLGAQYYLKAQ